MTGALVLDFEGTITEENVLPAIVAAFGEQQDMRPLNRALRTGEISLQTLLEHQFARIRAPLPAVVEWVLANARVRPGLRELVATATGSNLRPIVVSGAFVELIEPLLEREEVAIEVRAHRVDAHAEGWRVRWQSEDLCSECGERCKRGMLPKAAHLTYVGDGMSDLCPALAATRVFARDGLAEYFDSSQLPYEPFADLQDVARRLDELRSPATS